MNEPVKGYKAFDENLSCRGFRYEVGKSYHHDGDIELCSSGFHFCLKLADCFSYYAFGGHPRVCEIEASGSIIDGDDGKSVTSDIKILRELSWQDVLLEANEGRDCSGYRNSGNYNSGNSNSGDYNSGNGNSGNRNSGDWNSGYWNSGNWNSGNYNSGDCNSGYRNSGNRNSGDCNSGNYNSGNSNSGYWNSGDCNSGNGNRGDCNSGDCNSGYRNSGYWNSGNCNSGNRNSGDCNSGNGNRGDCNSGDWNSTYNSSGVLCTEEPECLIFDKPSGMTLDEWRGTEAAKIMSRIKFETTIWVDDSEMTDDEKKENPQFFVAGGYLKTVDSGYGFSEWWESLTEEEKNTIKEIPNFHAAKWKTITGIEV